MEKIDTNVFLKNVAAKMGALDRCPQCGGEYPEYWRTSCGRKKSMGLHRPLCPSCEQAAAVAAKQAFVDEIMALPEEERFRRLVGMIYDLQHRETACVHDMKF